MAHTLQAESAQTSHNSNLHDIIFDQEVTLGKLHAYLAALDWACASDHELRDVLLDAFDAIVNELIEQNDRLSKEWKGMFPFEEGFSETGKNQNPRPKSGYGKGV